MSYHVEESLVINSSSAEIYSFWRNFENLPRFMNNLKSVTVLDKKMSHWVGKGPLNTSPEWDAEVVSDMPNKSISWRSTEGSPVGTSGTVSFENAVGGRGTLVHVSFDYTPPLGVVGHAVALLFGEDPKKQVHEDLHRLQQIVEAGEISSIEGQPRAS